MRKLTLDLDGIVVETFATGSPAMLRGTVDGASAEDTQVQATAYACTQERGAGCTGDRFTCDNASACMRTDGPATECAPADDSVWWIFDLCAA